ncbi:TPA: tRNA-binding protein [Providencia rettgeri]|uniref:tRNA-binding protein n=1 Tax=Providencia rettgeri TaxID=587 RepID=A0AB35LAS8_PRORE|nr:MULTISPECIES: tRNA-binding protein [Providencia]MBG5931218.1 tRNA-binding protein [Providencia rettgeri]MBO8254131.1 tRNA-binding protein [Providencia rettgeri]MBO8257975.1 tRNA-binding protein [Providencia rettgeri]MBS0861717.1 tRNA-binding protein [Providencia rettgeri]MBS0874121.1 tRNA-binding protein [Providencia rettgeri]
MKIIEWDDFTRVEMRVGTIVSAQINSKAKKPAYVMEVDLGELGIKCSSAQITVNYTPEDLIGKQVLCVCNFEVKRIAGIKSEVLITGAPDETGAIVLAEFNLPLPNGALLA